MKIVYQNRINIKGLDLAHQAKAKFEIAVRTLPDGLTFKVKGRDGWALAQLVKAGDKGCTPIDNPGPRWSAYVFNLKNQYGLDVKTIHEPHRGSFPGTHARYVLLTEVEVIHEPAAGVTTITLVNKPAVKRDAAAVTPAAATTAAVTAAALNPTAETAAAVAKVVLVNKPKAKRMPGAETVE